MYNYHAFVNSVYDGDTITVDIDLGFHVQLKNQKIRLWGINTPELRGEQRESGLISRDALREKVLNQKVILQTHRDKKGKYGRWLAVVLIDDMNVNDWLVAQKLAQPYLCKS